MSTAEAWHVSVLIPVRNEEDLLPRCLRSVMAARERVLAVAPCDIVVAVDKSTDASFTIAQQMLGSHGVVIRCHAGIVGVARATAASLALDRRSADLSRTWLANTDADCEVSPTWLADQLDMARSGVHAVAGIVDVDSFADHNDFVPERFKSSYLLYPDGTHPHIHGANLGVRADAYLNAGGWAPLRTAEDHDLWGRLGVANAVRYSPSRLKVLTSGRRVGRAPMGFAAALAAHNEVAA